MLDPDQHTLVKGADGNLYKLTATGPPQIVPPHEAQQFESAVQNITPQLETLFNQLISNVAAGCNQTIRIVVPDVDL
jgi:hypothetical protein